MGEIEIPVKQVFAVYRHIRGENFAFSGNSVDIVQYFFPSGTKGHKHDHVRETRLESFVVFYGQIPETAVSHKAVTGEDPGGGKSRT